MQYAPGIPACPSWAAAVIARKKHFSAPLTPTPLTLPCTTHKAAGRSFASDKQLRDPDCHLLSFYKIF